MIRARRCFQLLISMPMILGILCGCASSHGKLEMPNYKSLMRQQLETVPGDATEKIALPEMTGKDHERLGDVSVSRGNLQMAFVQYEKCLKLNPENIRVKYKKGMVFVLGGLNDDAVREFRAVLKAKPEDSLAHEGIGLAFFQMKQYGDASRHFRKAIEIDSALWKAHTILGVIYDYQGQHDKAIREYRLAINLRPSDGLLYNNLGVSHLLAGHYEKAIPAFREGIKREPSCVKLYNNLGLALAKLGRYREALAVFMEHGDEAQAHNNLGCVYLQQGLREEAIRSFEKALEIKPTFYSRASQNLRKARAGRVYEMFSIESDK